MTKRDLALQLLRDAGTAGVTTGDFLRAGVGSRYSARVKELRDRGLSITTHRVRDGEWRYVLDPERGVGTTGANPIHSSSLVPSDVPPGAESVESAPAEGARADAAGTVTPPLGGPGPASLFELDEQPISAVTGRPVDVREAA